MTDQYLERISTTQRKLLSPPWVCWESENASFGRAFRVWCSFPSFLPMFVVSPHGAYSGSKIWPNEVDTRVKVFFGWPDRRVKRREADFGLPSYLVQHPWISFRRKNFPSISPASTGLLYFLPHSNPHMTVSEDSFGELREELIELSALYGGVTICLSFHDIRLGRHKELRSWGFPIVTAGDSNNTHFVDRFYELISRFRFTASSDLGSQVFYCIEAGFSHFLTKTNLKYVATGTGDLALGQERNPLDYGTEDDLAELREFENSLRHHLSTPSSFQTSFVAASLGIGQGLSPGLARLILYRELFLRPALMYRYLARNLQHLINKFAKPQ